MWYLYGTASKSQTLFLINNIIMGNPDLVVEDEVLGRGNDAVGLDAAHCRPHQLSTQVRVLTRHVPTINMASGWHAAW